STFMRVYETAPINTRPTISIRIASGRLIASRVRAIERSIGPPSAHDANEPSDGCPLGAASCADAACGNILPCTASGGKAVDRLFTNGHTSRVSLVRIALSLLALAGLLTVLGPLMETRQRAPEGIARAYLRAVEQGDLEAALATIEPSQREAQRER